MSKWTQTILENLGGRFAIIATPVGHTTAAPVDVTYFRGVRTEISDYSSGDPFGDATAVLTFPAITGFDDTDSPELYWLQDYTDIDIWWIPGSTNDEGSGQAPVTNPLTNEINVYAPAYHRGFHTLTKRGVKVWEGFIAEQSLNADDGNDATQVQCQGSLYQADGYLEKPFYPLAPQTLESLIQAVFDHSERPHLRTQPLVIEWPDGWTKIAPALSGPPNPYTPNVTPGQKYTGYTTRSTGAWDRSLTGYIQDQIAVMITDTESGVPAGNQWTVVSVREGDSLYSMGRQPVLRLRDRFRAPDFEYWWGTPGLKPSLQRDTTQSAMLVYGDGTGTDGTVWRNAVISHDGSRTDYMPLAADPRVWPVTGNPLFDRRVFAKEAYQKYGTGFNQPDAVVSASQTLQRDLDPGWSGTITVATDPAPDFSRWQIQAGMTLLLKGFRGTGAEGMRFHVSQVQANPMEGTVQLTVDTRYRDLLSVEEAIARTRDPLTPSKLLQVNRDSAIIEDVQAPWDYTAGSGYIPLGSKQFFDYCPTDVPFPYTYWSEHHPPFTDPQYYVQCNADDPDSRNRWAGPIPILTSEKGTIGRTEIFACDKYGTPLQVPFSLSLYYNNVTVAAMPMADGEYSAFVPGAFTSIDPSNGQPWHDGNFMSGDNSMIIVWGNRDQPAGYSPGQYADASGPTGNQPTGLLEDDSNWTFDNTQHIHGGYDIYGAVGSEPKAGITIYAMFYCEYLEPVYFMGRLFRQPQGV